MARKRTRKSASKDFSSGAAIAVYVLLGILVIGTSYYTGYLAGLAHNPGTASGGSQTGTVTIIEYSDFQCPFCSRAEPTVQKIRETYGDRVEIIYKEFPLESIHPNALNAAIAAECVRKDGGDEAFWKYHDTLFANQDKLDAANLKTFASQQGYDIASCLDNQETLDVVRADQAEGRQRGVSGTPSFWIQDELVVGAQPFEAFQAKIDEKLSGAPAAPQAPAPQQAPQAPAQPVAVADGTYVLGNANAPVTIVEFTDYQCPFCGRAHQETYPQIVKDYVNTGKVRYTVRNFPLPFHENAEKAAEAAECAGKVGGNDAFWTYHDTLFAHQDALGVANLKQYAADQGLDSQAFDSCLDSGEFQAKIQNDIAVGSQAGVSGTPSFFVNGRIVVGAQPYNVFQSAIESALQ